jgi:hypothetical protein
LAQAACYRAITATPKGAGAIEMVTKVVADAPNHADFDWIGDGSLSLPTVLAAIDFKAEQSSALKTASTYVTDGLRNFSRQYGA